MPLNRKIIETVLRKTPGIRDVAWLSRAEVGAVQRLESADPVTGANEGVEAVADRQHACATLSGPEFRHQSAPCVQWVVDGTVIGEEVTDPARRAGLLAAPGVGSLGENFFLYYNRMRTVRGKAPRFVYRSLPFSELAACDGVCEVVSASPGAAGDDYLKRRFEWPLGDAGLGTILIGFNLTGST
jgi:hypothetical protein